MRAKADAVPSALSTVTSITGGRGQRRARYKIPGARANTPPVVIPGEKVFRVSPDSPKGRAAVRAWARRNGREVKDYGKIPVNVRDAFMEANDIWTVRVISCMPPGADQFYEFFEVKQGSYVRKRTTKWWEVLKILGDELFPLLKEVGK